MKVRIDLLDDRVEKRQSEGRARQEFYGTEMGRRVARQSGHFHVPQIFAAELDAGLIVFERIFGAESLRKLLPTYPNSSGLIVRAAKALAAIHNLGEGNAESGAEEFSHGDYSIDNLFYDPTTDRLYIIDWALPVWQSDVKRAGRYQDLTIFVKSLYARPVFYRNRIRHTQQLASIFFQVYSENTDFDPSQMKVVFHNLLSQNLRYQRELVLWRFLANYPSTLRCRRFVARLSRKT